MNGPEHYAAAEAKLVEFAEFSKRHNGHFTGTPSMLVEAQVHATLAVAAGQVTHIPTDGEDPANFDTVVVEVGWEQVLGFEVMRRDGGVTR